jgi:hypothetical protein
LAQHVGQFVGVGVVLEDELELVLAVEELVLAEEVVVAEDVHDVLTVVDDGELATDRD